MAPDLLLSWWDDDSFTIRPSTAKKGGEIIRSLDEGFDNLVNWSGTHRFKGIFLFKGKPFKNIQIGDGTKIVDLAPTLLYLMGCPVPQDMDGKVIEAAFREDYLKSNPVKYNGGSTLERKNMPDNTYSEEEAAMVEKRLKSLGYM